jgi:hypothetical protein
MRTAILDLDATVLTVYGRQQRSAVGYNPQKHGRPSYLPLLCFEGQSRDVFCGAYHPGNTRAHMVANSLIEEALAKLPHSTKTVRIRADAAFCERRCIEFLEEKGVFYVIPSAVKGGLKNRIGGLRYHRISKEVWAAEFQYMPQGWGHKRRFVIIRRPVPEEPSAQLHLFRMEGFSYQVLVSNMSLQPLNLWRFYNGRSSAELIIRELKHAYALGKIPTSDFAANEIFFQLLLLAYNLLNWFKRLCVPTRWQRMNLERLRQRLLLVPAQFVRPGGSPTLRIMPGYIYSNDFLDILKRIEKTQPFQKKCQDNRYRSGKRKRR